MELAINDLEQSRTLELLERQFNSKRPTPIGTHIESLHLTPNTLDKLLMSYCVKEDIDCEDFDFEEHTAALTDLLRDAFKSSEEKFYAEARDMVYNYCATLHRAATPPQP